MTHTITTLLAVAATTAFVSAGEEILTTGLETNPNCNHCLRPDNHGPIGVMGDHMHPKGEIMTSYRYMFMSMQRNYDGTSEISDQAALSQGYMMVPTDMEMQMHMLGLMYAPTHDITLMFMANYLDSDMSMIDMMGMKSTMQSSGWGDTTLGALYSIHSTISQRAHIGLGLSLPTGSIDETLPNGLNQPYGMQLGSGTWDLLPSITWTEQFTHWSWGTQVNGVLHLGRNDNGYTVGDRLALTAWTARPVTQNISLSARVIGSLWDDVKGRDNRMAMPTMTPAADPNLRGGSRIDLVGGINWLTPIKGGRLAAEVGAPVWQDLNGPQLGNDWFCTLGLQFVW